MNIRVIANPVAGGGRGKGVAESMASALERRGETVDLFLTRKAGDGREAAGESGFDCVVAVGGDGSVNEIVNGLASMDTLLAIVPMGTANVVARELRIPNDPEAVAELLVSGRHRMMDIGLWGDERFLLGAGAGLDAAITAEVSQHRGKRSGLSKWVWPSIKKSFSYSFPKMRGVVDGEVLCEDAQYAIVGNCRYSAGVFPATPKARVDDGLLDVCLLRNLSVARLAVIACTVWRESFLDHRDVFYAQGKHVELIATEGEDIPLQVDGDPAGLLPAVFSMNDAPIRVVCP